MARILVVEDNPDIALACALGHAYGPQPERGVFRTMDGGKSWASIKLDGTTPTSRRTSTPRRRASSSPT